MATLTDISKHNATMTAISKPLAGGQIFYAWMFLFTITTRAVALTGFAKNNATITSIAKH